MEIKNNSSQKKNISQVKPSHMILAKFWLKAAVKAIDGLN